MKNTTILIVLAIIVIAAGAYFFGQSSSTTGKVVAQGTDPTQVQGTVQKVVLSEKDLNYYPQTIKVKSGQPVSISLDSNVKGCLRSFTIPQLGVRKFLKNTQDTLDFTPTQKGTYKFSCSMGMGYGNLVVE